MATFSQDNITSLFVGSAATKTTGAISGLNAGEIGIFTPSGTMYTEATASAGAPFVIVQGRGTATPIVSKPIKKANVKAVVRKVTVAASEQVDYIGYNTTSGEIEAIDDNFYFVRLNIDQSLTSNHGGQYIKHGQYKTGLSATQVEVANGITDSILKNFSREPEKQIKVERVTSSTVTGATTGNLTVVNGSQYVTAATDIDNGGAVAGDYLVISGIAYKVLEFNVGGAQVAKLDTAYQGASATVADASVGFITAANAALGDWGIKLTGLALNFVVGKKSYRKVKWDLTVQDFGTTTITKSAGPNPGVGVYEQAAELEFFLRGNDGEYFHMGEPNIFDRITDVTNQSYDILEIQTEEEGGTLVTKNFRKINFMLLIPNSTPNYALSATADDITDVLEILLDGAPVYGGAVTTVSGGALVTGDLAL